MDALLILLAFVAAVAVNLLAADRLIPLVYIFPILAAAFRSSPRATALVAATSLLANASINLSQQHRLQEVAVYDGSFAIIAVVLVYLSRVLSRQREEIARRSR